MKIHKGDTVKVLAGKDKSKTGKVIKVNPNNSRVTVEGVNLYKKHVRPKRQGEKGEIVQVVRPINSSNLMLVCSSCNRATRVGYRLENDKKVRYCKKCKSLL
ncbi:MAG: 50S ribosomal protein L24 [Patescibacteria group bacterium]|nr:50S ribosomal protein L24 [Patescibacteria group bacterium]